jgi:hypothetical protein
MPFALTTSNAKPPLPSPCPKCQGVAYWANHQRRLFCSLCTPPPSEGLVVRRLAIEDGELVDTTERDFRLKYPPETWDYFDHLNPLDLAYLSEQPSQEPCPWCGRRGGQHTRACADLHDDWEIRISFGKHKGKKLKDLPPDYLRFLLGWDKLHEDLRREISRMLKVPYKEPLHDEAIS